MEQTVTLANGTRVTVGPCWAVTQLPGGEQVHAHPNPDTGGMAEKLGYGADLCALTRDHDLLHSLLACWLGQPHSYSLAQAAGLPVVPELAWLEESAVLAIQSYVQGLARAGLAAPAPPAP